MSLRSRRLRPRLVHRLICPLDVDARHRIVGALAPMHRSALKFCSGVSLRYEPTARREERAIVGHFAQVVWKGCSKLQKS